jgi:hypothetical protein
MYKLLTCPESVRLALIDCDLSPLGILIRECSLYPCELTCSRECAARLDRRGLTALDDRSWLEPNTENDGLSTLLGVACAPKRAA